MIRQSIWSNTHALFSLSSSSLTFFYFCLLNVKKSRKEKSSSSICISTPFFTFWQSTLRTLFDRKSPGHALVVFSLSTNWLQFFQIKNILFLLLQFFSEKIDLKRMTFSFKFNQNEIDQANKSSSNKFKSNLVKIKRTNICLTTTVKFISK